MQPYQKVYCDYFGYKILEDIICEVTNDGTVANSIHHINGRTGKNLLDIKNMIAITGKIHRDTHFGKAPYTKSELMQIHAEFMAKNGIKHV